MNTFTHALYCIYVKVKERYIFTPLFLSFSIFRTENTLLLITSRYITNLNLQQQKKPLFTGQCIVSKSALRKTVKMKLKRFGVFYVSEIPKKNRLVKYFQEMKTDG